MEERRERSLGQKGRRARVSSLLRLEPQVFAALVPSARAQHPPYSLQLAVEFCLPSPMVSLTSLVNPVRDVRVRMSLCLGPVGCAVDERQNTEN